MELPGICATRRVEKDGDGYIVYVKPPDFFRQEEVAVYLTADQYTRYQEWREGAGMIQDLLWDLDEDQIEKLLSGLTDENFRKAWGEEQ